MAYIRRDETKTLVTSAGVVLLGFSMGCSGTEPARDFTTNSQNRRDGGPGLGATLDASSGSGGGASQAVSEPPSDAASETSGYALVVDSGAHGHEAGSHTDDSRSSQFVVDAGRDDAASTDGVQGPEVDAATCDGSTCDPACEDGICTVDPCYGVACDAPPSNYCNGTSEFVAFDAQGTCVDGECVYAPKSISCDCDGEACLVDPCEQVDCSLPPASRCNENGTKTTYASKGTCSDGTCTYEASFTACDACADGECYCPAGYSTGVEEGQCERCSSGTFSSERNSDKCSPHTACTPGEFIAAGGTSTKDQTCAACQNGSFSVANNALACSPFSDCSAGQFVVANGNSTKDRECAGCGSRSFSTSKNASACNSWSDCSSGQYVSQAGSATRDQSCSACAPGSYSSSVNATVCAPFTVCVAGQRVSQQGNATSDRKCTTCTNGYSTGSNAESCTAHSDCSAGQYVAQQPTATSNRVCAACPAGHYSTKTNADSCIPYTACGSNEVEKTAGTKTADRTCTCAPGHAECDGECVSISSVTYYEDDDGDAFGNAAVSKLSCDGAPAGFVADATDCCDIDGNARPTQTFSFTTETRCGGYDYDCNGQSVLGETRVAACGGGGGSCGCSAGWLGSVPACGDEASFTAGGNTCDNFPVVTQACR